MGASFYFCRYVYRRSDKPSMKLTIPQPSGTTHWKLGLLMDQNVENLHVRTSDASMTRLTEVATKHKFDFEIWQMAKAAFSRNHGTINFI